MAIKVSAVLDYKGHQVVTVETSQSVESVAQVLTANRIGAAPVLDDDGRLAGIISERDIIRGIASRGRAALELAAAQLMTREVRTCSPDDAIVELMRVMTHQRIRHLPVIRNGQLHGIISIGDVVKQRLEDAQSELDALRDYIYS